MKTDSVSTDLVSFRAAGWLAAPDGESRASTTALIEGLVSEIERLRTEMREACSDMGCFCKDDKPDDKCPMCLLEKALHG